MTQFRMQSPFSNVAILGYGVEGKAMLTYLLAHGYSNITVCDQQENLLLPDGVLARFGRGYLEGLDHFDIIFRSPGVRLSLPKLSRVSHEKLTSMTRYFFEHCPCEIIGVTGTKGKGTTSTLIYEMLKTAGRDVYLGGNIGQPPVNFLDRLQPDSLIVLELSSFQLQDLDRSPHVAVVLNITSEHMDYHGSVDEYVSAKQNIARYQRPEDFLILNRAHPYSAHFFSSQEFKGKKFFVDTQCHDSLAEGFIRADGMIVFDGTDILHRSEVGLLGAHNLENILPAVMVGRLYGVPIDRIVQVLKAFRGLPHRLEFVGEMRSVKFYNDSFSTIPETSIAAIHSFSQPLFLIAGGSEKKSVFDEWGAIVSSSQHLRKVFLMGPSGKRMARSISDASKYEIVENLMEAFQKAFLLARPGSVILLSPGAASFDQFENYKERGEYFRNLVHTITKA